MAPCCVTVSPEIKTVHLGGKLVNTHRMSVKRGAARCRGDEIFSTAGRLITLRKLVTHTFQEISETDQIHWDLSSQTYISCEEC